MFGWVRKRAMDASADVMKNDIDRFINGLVGADDEELSTLLVVANVLRLRLVESKKIPPAALNMDIPRHGTLALQCDMASITLSNVIKQYQKMGQTSDATGTMIWLHSIRALNVPEIRILGREMWGQLERGFPYVEDALIYIQEITDDRLRMHSFPQDISTELTFIPRGLEPRH